MKKLAKSAVHFEHPAKGPHHCSQCRHFIPNDDACHIVAGRVTPPDWCDHFDNKREARQRGGRKHRATLY